MDKTTIDSAVDAVRASVDDAYRQGLERAWKLAQFVCTDGMEHLYRSGLNPYGSTYDGDSDTSDIGEFEYSCCVVARNTIAEVLEKLSPLEYAEYQKTESAELPVGTIVVTTVDKDGAGCEVFPVGTIGRVVHIATSTMCELPYQVEAISPKDESHQFWYSADTLRVVPESVLTVLRTKDD